MKKLCLISALALTGCGGGGGGQQPSTGVSTTPTTPTSVSQEIVYYREVKNAIPSLSVYYERTCGPKANSFLVPALDLNKDNRKDLLIVLWCETATWGSVSNDPVKNTLISLIQNNDGTYRLGNQELFGKSFVELSGLIAEGVDVAMGDFNGDKTTDVVFSTTLEDGRFSLSNNGVHSWDSYPDVMMSQPDNTYKIERVGNRATHNEVILIKGNDRDSFTSNGYVFNYQNQNWSKALINYPWEYNIPQGKPIDKSGVFLDSKTVTQAIRDKNSFGWQLGSITNGSFNIIDSLILSQVKEVMVYGSTTAGDQVEFLSTIDGVEYIGSAYNSACVISEGSDTYIAAEFQAIKLQEKYTGQRLQWSNSPNQTGNVSFDNFITQVHIYKISNGKITKVDVPLLKNDIKTSHYINCVDVNGDNKKDVVVYRWGHKQEKSVIYLNNNNVSFTEVSGSKLPEILNVYNGHHVMFSDLNNDNRTEIIYGPGLGYPNGYTGNYTDYQVFQSVNPL
jgi:FG-GAP-like repeat